MLSLDKYAVNEPWRRLMNVMGLRGVEEIKNLYSCEEEVAYKFERKLWEEGKRALTEKGNWYL